MMPSMTNDSQNCLIYIVDDDEGVRDSLSWLLEGKGYRTQCFSSAENFLDGFDPHRLACLITDIRMAGASGLQLQDRLLEMGAPLPVAFITGHGDVPLAVSTMKKGAMDFIQKPFEEKALVDLVEKMRVQASQSFAAGRHRFYAQIQHVTEARRIICAICSKPQIRRGPEGSPAPIVGAF